MKRNFKGQFFRKEDLFCRTCKQILPRSSFDPRNDGTSRVKLRCKNCRNKWKHTPRYYQLNTPEERFWKLVKKSDNCWIWNGYVDPSNGYGSMRWNGKTIRIHRIAYLIAHKFIPKDECVLHKCDNPLCVKPDHLFLGNRTDNSIDKVAKGRQIKGSKHPFAKLTEIDVSAIRKQYNSGKSQHSLAKQFNITVSGINGIVHNRSWRHVKI